jgi:glycosyltransferase involved in cell wall biosynthesis
MPTYNRAGTLDRAIRSVLDQTFRDFELVITDDGSTDESRRILERYCGLTNVRVVSSTHRGCSAARNLGVTASTAPLVAFQDSDDEWLPNKLEEAVTALSSAGSGVGVFYSNMIRVHEDGTFSDWRSPDMCRGVLISESTLDYQAMGIGIQSAVIKRTCFAQAGLFDEALQRFIDLDLFIRLSERFDFHHHGKALVKFYAGGGISRDTQALVRARRYLIAKYRKRLRVERHHLAHQYLFLADALRVNGSKYRSMVLAVAALLRSPADPLVRRKAADIIRVGTKRFFVFGKPRIRGWLGP